MSTEIDQQEVRRLAATALRTAVQQRRDVAIGMAIYDRNELLPSTQGGFTTLHQAVGTEYDRLANTVARQENDVRTVRAVVDAAGALPIPQFESMPELAAALNALLEQFEDRIKVVDEAESLARLRAFGATLDKAGA